MAEHWKRDSRKAKARSLSADRHPTASFPWIATCPLPAICELADRYDAHRHGRRIATATGHLGRQRSRHRPRFWECLGRIDIITSTAGEGFGRRGWGDFTCAKAEVVDFLAAGARDPIVFSNSRAAHDRLRGLEGRRIGADTECIACERLNPECQPASIGSRRGGLQLRRDRLRSCLSCWAMRRAGQQDGREAASTRKGIYVIGFSFPVRAHGPGAHSHSSIGQRIPLSRSSRPAEAFRGGGGRSWRGWRELPDPTQALHTSLKRERRIYFSSLRGLLQKLRLFGS